MENQETIQQAPPTSTGGKAHKVLIGVVLLAVIVIGGVVAYNLTQKDKEEPAAPSTGETTNDGFVTSEITESKFSVLPTDGTIVEGATQTVEVWVDTIDYPVNAVRAELEYPTDKLEFQNFDSEGSAFEIQAAASAENGKIIIERAQIGNVVGKHLVAKINFVAKASDGKATINFLSGSAIVRASDAANIIGVSPSATYTLGAKNNGNE